MSGQDVPCMSGTLATGLVAVARETLGPELVERALARIPAETRALVDAALPGAWIPISAMETAFSAIAAESGRDIGTLHTELARISVERALKTFWRLLLRFTTDEALVTRTPVIFGKAYNRGRLVATIPRPNRGEVELLDWPDVPDWPIRGSRVGIEAVLRAAGRKDVRVEGHRTPTGALYVATWR